MQINLCSRYNLRIHIPIPFEEASTDRPMGSLDAPTSAAENGSTIPSTFPGDHKSPTGERFPAGILPVSDAMKKRKAFFLPLEVGTRVMCRWRDGKFHPVKVIERRKMHTGGTNDYEYYVHYTECKISQI